MREYRGKQIDGKGWKTGDLVRDCYNKHFIVTCYMVDDFGRESFEWHEVDPSTVGQYTGLKDNNDKEIYEGDILHVVYAGGGNSVSVSAVTYEEGCYMFEERNPFAPVFHKSTLRTVINHPNYNVTKIGNIHDNPELLEAE